MYIYIINDMPWEYVKRWAVCLFVDAPKLASLEGLKALRALSGSFKGEALDAEILAMLENWLENLDDLSIAIY